LPPAEATSRRTTTSGVKTGSSSASIPTEGRYLRVGHHRVVAAVLLASTMLTPAIAVTPVAADSGTRTIASGGTANLAARPSGPDAGVQAPEFARGPDEARDAHAGSSVQLRKRAGPSTSVAGDG